MGIGVGVRLGPYEIVAPLGAGGMGEVWRARDPRLGREGAVKVLPARVGADPERLRRFQQVFKAGRSRLGAYVDLPAGTPTVLASPRQVILGARWSF